MNDHRDVSLIEINQRNAIDSEEEGYTPVLAIPIPYPED